MMQRLSPATAHLLPATIKRADTSGADGEREGYPCIVHLGLGAFARAHIAAYTQDANRLAGENWHIIGVSLKRPDMRDMLAPQSGLYTLVTRAPEGPKYELINVVRECLVAPENPGAIIALLCEPSTRIVSLTITEKGYCHLPATGRLDLTHPDIAHDLANMHQPRSALGFIVAGLAARRLAGLPPFTVLCCDNLPANGKLLRGLVLEFAQTVAPALAEWIAREGAFPCTMVDRIVPATTAADIADVGAMLGLHDAAPVMAEPFRQWVIEDHFANGRPAWEKASAQMVSDVAPFELMKLRLLNGAHSSLAYLGYIADYETVAKASDSPAMAAFLTRLWTEIIPTVPAPEGVDLHAYSQALLIRFRNPAIHHRTWQIAMDGSQKLPQRLLGTLRERLAAGAEFDALALGLAGWMRYVMGHDEAGNAIDVRDPLSARFAEISTLAAGNARAMVDGLLAIEAIFGADLAQHQNLRTALITHLQKLLEHGAQNTLAAFAETTPNAHASQTA
ncbi:MAG: mannitol dehydrogenase family protein [Bosea sp. (in: a-proteobacteria)]